MTMLLAGDVGGTKTRLALCRFEAGVLKKEKTERYESAKFSSLAAIVSGFLEGSQARPAAACFGIPGPVIDGKVKVTNLPWELSEKDLSRELSIPKVRLVNDLVATAAAIPYFSSSDLLTLYSGKPIGAGDTGAVVAPGTGLGQAFFHMQGDKTAIFPSEGGHSNFAPQNEIQLELYRYLRKDREHVSVEHVLCGPGLANIYSFLKAGGKYEEPAELAAAFKNESPAAVISKNAIDGKYEICVAALDMFVDILGAHCSNVLLTVMATGGIFLGGGIPPKITEKLTDGRILETYLAKGKMRKQVAAVSLHVIKDDLAALHGAARLAAEL